MYPNVKGSLRMAYTMFKNLLMGNCEGKVRSVFGDQRHSFTEADDGTSLCFHGTFLKEVVIGSLPICQRVEFGIVESSGGFSGWFVSRDAALKAS
jgi:hypothetical protein